MIYLGYRTPSVKGLTLKEKINLAVELKLDAIEVGPTDIKTTEDITELRDLSISSNIMIKSLGLGGVPLCNPDLRESSLNEVKGLIEKAKILGINIIFARTMNPEPGVKQADTWRYCSDFMRLLCDVCYDNGIKLALEVDHGNFVQNLERAEYLFELVNHKNLYLNYDPANFYIGGSDPLKVIDRMKSYIINGHIKDAVYRIDKIGEAKIGQGELDYTAIFKKLNDENITIAMHLEHCRTAQSVIDGARYIKGILKDYIYN